jgi:hypothetical protein
MLEMELGDGRGGRYDARGALLADALEIPLVFGSGKVRELAAEGDDFLVCLGPVQRRAAIRPKQRVLLRGLLLVGRVRRLRMVWVLLMRGLMLVVLLLLLLVELLLDGLLLSLERGPRYVARTIGQVTIGRGR